jgi:hypothetical protein
MLPSAYRTLLAQNEIEANVLGGQSPRWLRNWQAENDKSAGSVSQPDGLDSGGRVTVALGRDLAFALKLGGDLAQRMSRTLVASRQSATGSRRKSQQFLRNCGLRKILVPEASEAMCQNIFSTDASVPRNPNQ